MLHLLPLCPVLNPLGQSLIRHQYGRFERHHDQTDTFPCVAEAGSAKPMDTDASEALLGTSTSSSTPSDGPEERANQEEKLDPRIGHVVWRKKQLIGRWASMKDLCAERLCPFIPSSALAMHRHLEVGHTRLFSVLALSRSQSMSQQPADLQTGQKASAQTTGEQTDCSQDRASSEEDKEGERAVQSDRDGDCTKHFLVSLLPDSVIANRKLQARFQCPACPRWKLSLKTFIEHCVKQHPFLTIQPAAAKAVVGMCNVCGFTNGRIHQLRPNLLAHYNCQLSMSTHRSLPWSNQDVPALACFILFPNQRSRFHLPEPMALHLIKTLDQVLTVHVGRLHLWRLDSMALRSVLAVSSLYGEVIDYSTVLIDDNVVSIRTGDDKAGTSKTQKVSIICCPPVEATITIATVATTTTTITAIAAAADLTLSSTNSSPSSASITTAVNTSITSSVEVNSRKRSLPVDELPGDDYEGAGPSKRPAAPRTHPEPTPEHDGEWSTSIDLIEGRAVNMDEYDDHGSGQEVLNAGPSSRNEPERTSSPAEQGSLPPSTSHQSAWLQAYLARQTQPPMLSPTVDVSKQSEVVSKMPCELCGVKVITSCFHQRMHMVSCHQMKSASIPRKHCYHCGQLFWTVRGRDTHKKITCPVCLGENVCPSTLYTHMILNHSAELLTSMQDMPAVCLLCEHLFTSTIRLVWHLYNQHSFRSPLEYFNRDYHTSKLIPLSVFDSSFPSTRLQDFKIFTLIDIPTKHRDVTDTLDLPPNIACKPASGSKTAHICFRCSICSILFISVPHLDLHMLQTGHMYACPDCNYSCAQGFNLQTHYTKLHWNQAVSRLSNAIGRGKQHPNSAGSSRAAPSMVTGPSAPTASSVRLLKLVNGTTTIIHPLANSCPLPNTVSTPVSLTPSLKLTPTSGSIVSLVGGADRPGLSSALSFSAPSSASALGQLHRCDQCPVLCLTLEDLNTHQSSAHAKATSGPSTGTLDPARLPQPTAMILPTGMSTDLQLPQAPAMTTTPTTMPTTTTTITATPPSSIVIQQRPFTRSHLETDPATARASPHPMVYCPTPSDSISSSTSVTSLSGPLITPLFPTAQVALTPTSLRSTLQQSITPTSVGFRCSLGASRSLMRPTSRSQSTTLRPTSSMLLMQTSSKSPASDLPASSADMIMCPLCEFQSTERSVILLHVANAHSH